MSDFLRAILKYSPDQPRAPAGSSEGGRWIDSDNLSYSAATVVREDGSIITSNVDDAVRALERGLNVELNQPREVSTLLDRLAAIAHAAEAAGTEAKVYDLCKVTVKGTNLFCVQALDVERIKMPQFIAKPAPGSPADALPRRKSGKVDITPLFLDHLRGLGYTVESTTEGAAYLRASQRQLNGGKVGDLMVKMRTNTLPYDASPPLIISEDNYIIDGHHRWAALVGLDAENNQLGDLRLPVHRVNIKILPLLDTANSYADRMGMGRSAVGAPIRKSWLQTAARLAKEWNESDHPRGKTTPASNSGSFAPDGIEEGAGREARPGDPVIVYRAHTRGPVLSGNAGNLAGVTAFIRDMEDFDTPAPHTFTWDGLKIHAYRIKAPEKWALYRGSIGGKTGLAPGEIGREAKGLKKDIIWYTIGEGVEAEHLGYIDVAEARKELERQTGETVFDDVHNHVAERVFRDMFHTRVQKDANWDESAHPRGKTTPESNSGSFAPRVTEGVPEPVARLAREWTHNDKKIEWSYLQHAAQYLIEGYDPAKYVLYDYRGDDQTLIRAARGLMEHLREAPPAPVPLYRGLHGDYLPAHERGKPAYQDDPVREFKVGDEFSESITSWTENRDLAQQFADDLYSDEEFRSPRKGVVMMLEPEGSRGLPISQFADEGNATLRNAQEWLATGRYRVEGVENLSDGTRLVRVRRVGDPTKEGLAKWDESAHPRGKTGEGTNAGSFAPSKSFMEHRRANATDDITSSSWRDGEVRKVRVSALFNETRSVSVIKNPTAQDMERFKERLQTYRYSIDFDSGNYAVWNAEEAIHWQIDKALGVLSMGGSISNNSEEPLTGGSIITDIRQRVERAFKRGHISDDQYDAVQEKLSRVSKAESWLDRLRALFKWEEDKHPRGKTTPESNAGSFAPAYWAQHRQGIADLVSNAGSLTAEDVKSGRHPLLSYRENFYGSSDVLGQYQPGPGKFTPGTVTLSASYFADSDPLGRSLLLSHEFGHAIQDYLSWTGRWPEAMEAFEGFRTGGSGITARFDNPVGLSSRPEEMMADVYSTLLLSKTQPWEEDEGRYGKMYRYVLRVASEMGLPLPEWHLRKAERDSGWDEAHHPRGKTTPESNSGSFAPLRFQRDLFGGGAINEIPIVRGENIVPLYHGSSTDVLPVILEEGLRPGSMTGVRRWDEQDYYSDIVRKTSVFMTTKARSAVHWAKRSAMMAELDSGVGARVVILKIEVPEEVVKKLIVDRMASSGEDEPTHYMHRGFVPPDWIKGYVDFAYSDPMLGTLSRADIDIELLKNFVPREKALAKASTRTMYVPIVLINDTRKTQKSWLETVRETAPDRTDRKS